MTFSLSMAGPELTPELLAVPDLDVFLNGYLLTTADNQWQAVCLEVDHNDCLVSATGELAQHGLEQLRPGDDLSERLPFLPGAAQDNEPLFIDFFEASACNRVVHVHVMAAPDRRRRIVLLDATRDFARHFALQQQANELDLLTQQQDRLKTSLEAANAVKAQFIAGMSYEFRTPLMAVLGYLERIRTELPGGVDQAVARHLDHAQHSARHLLDLIANVLDQSQIEAGKIVLNPSPHDVRRVFADLDGIFAPVAAEKGLRWSVTVQAVVPASVLVDAARLRQIVSNLIGNAIRFTDQGFVQVTVDWRDERLEIAVTDSGPGISVAAQKAIFRALNHHQPMTARGWRGAGLGLSISFGLARQMAGTLELESELGRGSCFSVAIPLVEATDQAQPDASVLSGLELVLADSHHAVRDLLNGLLSEQGVRVYTVEDGAQALQAVQQQMPEVLLIDQHLPVMTGKEVVTVLRSRGFTGTVVMMSTVPDQAEQTAVLAAGVNHVVAKPIDRDGLIRTLCACLSETD